MAEKHQVVTSSSKRVSDSSAPGWLCRWFSRTKHASAPGSNNASNLTTVCTGRLTDDSICSSTLNSSSSSGVMSSLNNEPARARVSSIRDLLTSCLRTGSNGGSTWGSLRRHQIIPSTNRSTRGSSTGFSPADGRSPVNGRGDQALTASVGWNQNKLAFGDLPTFPLSQRDMFTVVRTWKSVQKEIVDTGMRMFLT
jgi:hypothetical protein